MIGGTHEEVTREEHQGMVRVASTPPGAGVFLDDAWVGVTPLTLPLPYERAQTDVYKDLHILGYLLDVAWIPLFWPAGITFLIYDAAEDGDFVSRRTTTEPRTHSLRISKDGYEEVVRAVRVPYEPVVQVALRELGARPPDEPSASLGHLVVGSDPTGIAVVIEAAGEPRMTTKSVTPVAIALPPGRYRIEVADTRFVQRTSEIEVRAGAEVRLELAPRPR